ncbi:hypothetical protein HUJ05_008899 [Dendroctonus ponderosae]|nr:hypothetical protein HUJ05_008899 [Dendroctonus ponderosae]
MEDKTQIFLCGICKGPSFSTRFSLRAHVKKFHPGKVEELVPKKTYNISAVCDKCNKAFSQYSSMRQHVRNFHPVFYKAQDELCEGYPHLKSQDFLLILMTDGPKEMLNKFGRDCICIDGTFGSNCYGFDLVTLLVLDDMREGFPCSFLISSRTDAEVMSIFFYFIGQSLETQVSPKVFMSDTSESFFKAWLRVMGPPKYRLFCTWHVERAWKENLTKITSKETEVYLKNIHIEKNLEPNEVH